MGGVGLGFDLLASYLCISSDIGRAEELRY